MRFDRMLYTTFFMLLALLALAQTAHCQAAYNVDRDAKLFNAQGQTYTIINRIGALNLTFEYVVSGSPASLTMTIAGCMRGGTCDTLDTYSGTSSSNRKITGLYDSYTATVTTLSGGSTPTVQMNVMFTAASSPASAQGSLAAQVQGTAAAGAAPVGNPIQIASVEGQLGTQFLLCTYANTNDGRATNIANCGNIATDLFNGASYDRAFYCPNTATFSVASTITQVVPLSGTTKIRVCSFSLNPATATAGSTDIIYGTGANCGTGTTTLTGAYTLPASAVVNAAMFNGGSPSGALVTPAGQAVCIRTVTSTVNGFMTWAQY